MLVASGDFYMQDDRKGLLLRLPLRQLTGAWDAANSQYRIVAGLGGGSLQWPGSMAPLDELQLKSAIAGGGFSIESLRVVSRGSEMEVRGSLSGAPSRLEASADLNLELSDVSPARGRLRTHFSATGLLSSVQLQASLQGGNLLVGGLAIQRPAAEVTLDASSGEVSVASLSAGILGGRLSANGKLSVLSRSDPSRDRRGAAVASPTAAS